ncbi:hypothetical protein [Streptomyces sp. H27-C3]|uniref:hypothetical protein n=1 Tax=Streptomyces sp. H27-C3 TaxID=3046305 RepID=UPI0024BA189D|nr:hypothetical protein [Streptomyces sp. H27-C3]MDJ0464055.1 hypothetical protein [Streptomyces sp. H27-C3]
MHTEIPNNSSYANDLTSGIDESPATTSNFADLAGSINETGKNFLGSGGRHTADIPHSPSMTTSEAPTVNQN